MAFGCGGRSGGYDGFGRRIRLSPSGAQAQRQGHHRARGFREQHGRSGFRRHAPPRARRSTGAIAFYQHGFRRAHPPRFATDGASARRATHGGTRPRDLPAHRKRGRSPRLHHTVRKPVHDRIRRRELPDRGRARPGAGPGREKGGSPECADSHGKHIQNPDRGIACFHREPQYTARRGDHAIARSTSGVYKRLDGLRFERRRGSAALFPARHGNRSAIRRGARFARPDVRGSRTERPRGRIDS